MIYPPVAEVRQEYRRSFWKRLVRAIVYRVRNLFMEGDMREYPCNLSPSRVCEYGGNRRYNYGFLSGMASWCGLEKRWVSGLKKCPRDNETTEASEIAP